MNANDAKLTEITTAQSGSSVEDTALVNHNGQVVSILESDPFVLV